MIKWAKSTSKVTFEKKVYDVSDPNEIQEWTCVAIDSHGRYIFEFWDLDWEVFTYDDKLFKEYLSREDPRTEGKVTRVEVIDSNGRAYVNMDVESCELSYQDKGRTLKIFIR